MQTTINIQKAGTKNFDAICQLLSEEHLPTTDLNPLLENFFVAAENNEIAGVIGMDKYGDVGLLRSVIIKKSYRKKGIAAALINQVFIIAKKQNMVALYLITNTAETYFEKKGFKKIERIDVPVNILQSKEFNGLCPASSVIMFRKL